MIALLRVMLNEGLAGICTGFLPQYLTRAMFEGLRQDILPVSGFWILVSGFKFLVSIDDIVPIEYNFQIFSVKIFFNFFGAHRAGSHGKIAAPGSERLNFTVKIREH